jgi:outer membrane protein assembly factor BamA
LFERFSLGNSATLRGWNKFDMAPLGGNRTVHNELEYRYRIFRVFYDTGAVWNRSQQAAAKHSLGFGLFHHDFTVCIAFPIKDGRAEPVFMAGLTF